MTTSAPTPVSPVQAEALRQGIAPPLEQIREGIWTLAIPADGGVANATLTYVLEGTDGSLTLLDPGWGTASALAVLDDGLRQLGRSIADVGFVVVTHLHADHLGAAAAVRRASGARIAIHGNELAAIEHQDADRRADEADIAAWGAPEPLRAGLTRAWGTGRRLPGAAAGETSADVRIGDDDVLPIPGRTLRAVWTPGHTTGHLCFVDEAAGLLFTGDHVLPRINSGIGLGGRSATNPLEDFLSSLDRIAAFPGVEVCPGHEYRFADVAARAAALADHRRQRNAFVADALDAVDRPTMWEVASRVPFTGGIASMSGLVLASALAQTSFHVRLLGREDEVASAS